MRQRQIVKDTGDWIGGYILGERIGAGGMGVVHEARRADQVVAIKMLYADCVADGSARDRFHQEARAGAAIAHPGVVQVLEEGQTEDGYPYLVMERVPGVSLATQLASGLSPRDAASIVIAVLEGLAALHGAELVHGDVKPDNVLVDRRPDGSCATKLIDLGLARRSGTADAVDFISGTPLYMAPEVIRGGVLSPASDQYAVAVMLYEALTGRAPFRAATSAKVFRCHLEEVPAPPSSWDDAALPQVLDAIVLRALQKHPGNRFESATAFADALRAILPVLPDAPGPSSVAFSEDGPTLTITRFAKGRVAELGRTAARAGHLAGSRLACTAR